jgi:hypothetical protein
MLDIIVLRIEEKPIGHNHFDHMRWYGVKYGLGVFKEGIVIDDDIHERKCN